MSLDRRPGQQFVEIGSRQRTVFMQRMRDLRDCVFVKFNEPTCIRPGPVEREIGIDGIELGSLFPRFEAITTPQVWLTAEET